MSRTYKPRSLYIDLTDTAEDHGAAVLLVVRNGVARTWDRLCKIFRLDRDGRSWHSGHLALRGAIEELLDANMLKSRTGFKGPYRVTDHGHQVIHALGISLTQAANMPYYSGLAARPVFGKPNRLLKAAHVFVLMPFSQDLRAVYAGPIARACGACKLSVERADDMFSAHEVMEDIWSAIASSLVVVADCTGRNPNVFYELGIAHTLGRQAILLSQRDEDVPSDVRHVRYIRYSTRPSGLRTLESALAATLAEIRGTTYTV